MNLIFRRMKYGDVQQVCDLERKIFTDAWPKDTFVYAIENRLHSYPFLMIGGDQIIGYGVVAHLEGEIQINNIAVVPEFRGRGYGAKMLGHILEKFPDAVEAFLEVRLSNTAAIRLYEKFNFERIYLRKRYYSDGEDALVMRRISALGKG